MKVSSETSERARCSSGQSNLNARASACSCLMARINSPLIRFPGPHHPNPRWEGQAGVKMAGGSPGCWPVTVNLRGPSDVRRKRSHLAAPIMHGSPGAWQLGPVRASTNPPWITRVFSVILSFLRKSPRLVQRTLVGSLRP